MIYVKPEVGDWMVYVGVINATNEKRFFIKSLSHLIKDCNQLTIGQVYRVTRVEPSSYDEIVLWLGFDDVISNGLPLFMFKPYNPYSKEESSITTSLKEKFKVLSPEDNEIVEVNLEF